ncbi:MAG: metal/formaldehyde-sensitive transcriptional repressor [Lautropia sp.]|nr:metal/formaldehyde-sensitive transcriptional repressor [Lautropia sp.]
MAHTIRDKKALLTRVRRIGGQAAALEKALDKEAPCADILQQIAAIRGAVNGLMSHVLEGHIQSHLGAENATPRQRQEDIEVVVKALRSYLK